MKCYFNVYEIPKKLCGQFEPKPAETVNTVKMHLCNRGTVTSTLKHFVWFNTRGR